MDYETYYIPANYTDAGKILGIFEIRNLVEAVLLGIPVFFACIAYLPFDLTIKVIVTLIIFVPVVGVALIGINDDSLSRYLKSWWKWKKNKRILTYRGEVNYHEFERVYIRCRQHQGA